MTVNRDKTKVMVFRNGGTLRHSDRYYDGKQLETFMLYVTWCHHIVQDDVESYPANTSRSIQKGCYEYSVNISCVW